jgi:sirohydrochlorin cobaltochelatase
MLVASFGTSYAETRKKTIGAIEDAIAKAFPDWEFRRAFTSKMVIKKLAQRDGEKVDYIDEALDRLAADGFDTVAVQPVHVMNGMEYDDVARIALRYEGRFASLAVGKPMLTSDEDYGLAVEAISSSLAAEARDVAGEGAAVVLMGHGSEHHANAAYSQLYLKLLFAGMPDVYVTTVEGFPGFEETMRLMGEGGYDDAVLFPFMLVAGDHAVNDMAGDGEGSLKKALEGEGYRVRCVLKGLGEYAAFRDIFVRHAAEAAERASGGAT